jgi:hypothetical protein
MWISEAIPGRIQGKPIITKVDPGDYIFFTHNRVDIITGEVFGSFSMMNGKDGVTMFTEVAGESRMDPEPSMLERISTLKLPYSALGVSHSPEYGRYPGGENNNHDLFVWSTGDLEGRSDNGYTRAFQLPKYFEPEFSPGLATFFLREARWNAIAAPAVTADGLKVVFGVRANSIRGWTGAEDFDDIALLAQNLGSDPDDERLRKSTTCV